MCIFHILWRVTTLTSALKHRQHLIHTFRHTDDSGLQHGINKVQLLSYWQETYRVVSDLPAQETLPTKHKPGSEGFTLKKYKSSYLTIFIRMPCWNENNFSFLFALSFGFGFHLHITVSCLGWGCLRWEPGQVAQGCSYISLLSMLSCMSIHIHICIHIHKHIYIHI